MSAKSIYKGFRQAQQAQDRHKKNSYAYYYMLINKAGLEKTGIRHKKWEKVVLQIIIYNIFNLRNFIKKIGCYAYFSEKPFRLAIFS